MIRFIWADMKGMSVGAVAVVVLIALATAFGVIVTLGERAVRLGSARAADHFDIVIGAAGSPVQLLLSSVFLQPAALPLVSGTVLEQLQQDKRVVFAAPLGFGDSYLDYPIVGTTAAWVENLYGRVQQGQMFIRDDEAVAGALVSLDIGQIIHPVHGRLADGGHRHEHVSYRVVGRLAPSGTVWDRAVLVSMKSIWHIHGMTHRHGNGHGIFGHPSDGHHASGVPAIVVKPRTIADAYKLRQEYRTPATLAIFPAEVLTGLYATLGDVRRMLAMITAGMQALVAGCIAFVAILHIQTRRRQIAALRILGVSRFRILAIVWLELFVLLLSGLGLGCLAGFGLAALIANFMVKATGIVLFIEWQDEDWHTLLGYGAIAAILALVPAALAWCQKPVADIRR